jgi:antagonist of KipI
MMRFLSEPWTVSDQSNRQGIRLLGRRLTGSSELGQQMPSEGVALGAVQVPPSGEPVILFVDSQTTGGYPVIANVARVDVGVLGQLTPGSPVRFDALSFGDAQRLIVEQEQWIRACCV